MSLEWQNPNTERPKPVEKTERVESVSNFEQELSPEQIEKIMEKVQDVNTEGTAFTILRESVYQQQIKDEFPATHNRISNIGTRFRLRALLTTLKVGLLGNNTYKEDEPVPGENIKKRWQRLAKEKTALVFGNIIGRDISQLSENRFLAGQGNDDQFGIIYDINNFTEVQPYQWPGGDYRSHKDKAFRMKHDASEEDENSFRSTFFEVIKLLDLQKLQITYDEFVQTVTDNKDNLSRDLGNAEDFIEKIKQCGSYEEITGNPKPVNGFAIAKRVPPRMFNGIVYRPNPYHQNSAKTKEEFETKVSPIVNKIVELMKIASTESKNASYLPIYLIDGQLMWPKQMSYEDVKKFVAEREAKNTNKDEK